MLDKTDLINNKQHPNFQKKFRKTNISASSNIFAYAIVTNQIILHKFSIKS